MRLVLDEGKSVPQVARDLDVTQSALRTWVERARADRTKGKTGLTTMERDILKEAAALMDPHNSITLSRGRAA